MKFSIIIPVYNVAPFLRECLDSVLSQTYNDWECICVDDGSTDESGKILDEYVDEVERLHGSKKLRVIHKANQGVSSARNVALDMVSGEWVVFVDADDCIHSSLLEVCHSVCAKVSPDAVMFDRQLFKTEHGATDLDEEGEDLDISRKLPYDVMESDFFQFVYSVTLVEQLRFPPYVMGEDRLFLCWALIRADKLVRLRGTGYYYRQRPGSAVYSNMSWRKVHDDVCHSIRRVMALLLCNKHVEWHVYRHQIGLWVQMVGKLFR